MKNIAAGDLLEVRVIRGVNLAVRDIARRSSDTYVTLITLGRHQKVKSVKTRVVHQSCHISRMERSADALCASNSEHTVHLIINEPKLYVPTSM
ncbi:hypothetical protein QQ045_017476 [Rhodiola kirilowii]